MSDSEAQAETPGKRLRQFVDTAYSTVKAFARAAGMQSSNLHKYLKDQREACVSVLARFGEAGCDIHWMVMGEGDMFADNEKGRELRKKFGGGDGASATGIPAFLREQQKLTLELDRVRQELWQTTAERREELLIDQCRLLEKLARLLERENDVQKGRIEVLERMFETRGGGSQKAKVKSQKREDEDDGDEDED